MTRLLVPGQLMPSIIESPDASIFKRHLAMIKRIEGKREDRWPPIPCTQRRGVSDAFTALWLTD